MKPVKLLEQAGENLDQVHYAAACRVYKKVLARPASPAQRLRALLGLGHGLRMLARFKEAGRYYRQALQLSRVHKDKASVLDAQVGLAMSLRGQEKYEEACRLLERSVVQYGRQHDRFGLFHSLWFLAGTLRLCGRLDHSAKFFRHALGLAKRLGYEEGVAYGLCGLGGINRVRGDARSSLLCYQQACRLFNKLKNPFGLAYSSCGIGNAFRILGRTKNALAWTKLSIRRYLAQGDRVNVGYTYFTLAMLYMGSAQFSSSRTAIARMKRLFSSVQDNRGLVYVDLGLANLSLAQNRLDQAPVFFRKGLSRAVRLKLPLEKLYCLQGLHPIAKSLNDRYFSLGCVSPVTAQKVVRLGGGFIFNFR